MSCERACVFAVAQEAPIRRIRPRQSIDRMGARLTAQTSRNNATTSWQRSRIGMGLLGATLERDASGYYKITKIHAGSAWDPKLASPLAAPGGNAKVGEFLLAIDGKPVNELKSPYQALVNKVGKPVVVRLGAKPEMANSRDVVVVPIASDSNLLYRDWVDTNRKRVDEATKGKVAYIHVPDMQQNGLNEFVRQFYPQVDKKALVIDMRGNGGGNVSPMLIERLRREVAMIGIARGAPPGWPSVDLK